MHWNALEADFQRFYHLDLRGEVATGGCRRLWALVDALPGDAVVWTRLRPKNDLPQIQQFFSSIGRG